MTSTLATIPRTLDDAPDTELLFASPATYKVTIRDLLIDWHIGVFKHEHHRTQPVLINITLEAKSLPDWQADDYSQVPCYATLCDAISELAAEGHVELVETLAHRIALLSLQDDRITASTVRIEKPDAVKNANSVGVEVTLSRQ